MDQCIGLLTLMPSPQLLQQKQFDFTGFAFCALCKKLLGFFLDPGIVLDFYDFDYSLKTGKPKIPIPCSHKKSSA